MKLVHRFGYYFGGFTIGIVILIFFLSGKKTSCAYGLDARTLKNIRNKERVFSEETIRFLEEEKLDTSVVSKILLDGDVLFDEKTRGFDSCKIYNIEAKVSEKNLKITVENCNEKATVQKMEQVVD